MQKMPLACVLALHGRAKLLCDFTLVYVGMPEPCLSDKFFVSAGWRLS